VQSVESILPIECEIHSLRLVVALLPETFNLEQCIVHLQILDEQHRDASMTIEVNKRCVKFQYDKSTCPRKYIEGDLFLLYNQAKGPPRVGKFKPMWHGPYIVQCVLEKGTYELEDCEGNMLVEPKNGLYLKRYYT
jgi:hypothetical protein